MKFFIDTANIDEIKAANELGVLDGVTTNPSLIAREKGDFKEIIAEICRTVEGPVSAEVVSLESEGMLKEARDLAKIADNVVIKVPVIREGIKAVKMMTSEGIKTNVTLVFSPTQALMAAKVGASYVSPFVGRLDDRCSDGMELVNQIRVIFDNYEYETEIIVASIRNPLHVVNSALMGADIATIPFKVIGQLLEHPLTDLGLEAFLKDWDKTGKQSGKK